MLALQSTVMASPILSFTCCEVRNNILSLVPSGDKNTLKSYDPEGGQILLFGPDFKVVIPWESWQWVGDGDSSSF